MKLRRWTINSYHPDGVYHQSWTHHWTLSAAYLQALRLAQSQAVLNNGDLTWKVERR